MNGVIIFGEKGSGKDTVAEYIEKFINGKKEISFFNIGDLVRNMSCMFLATNKWNNKKREFYIDTAKKLKELDENFLNYYVLGKILEKFKVNSLNELEDTKLLIITGGRTEEDYNFWKERKFQIIGVACEESIRQERLKGRDGYFQQSQDSLEKDTKNIIEKADFIINNSKGLKELEKEIYTFINESNLK